MSETPAAYLESPSAPHLRTMASMAAIKLISDLRIQPDLSADGAVDLNLRIRILPLPDANSKPGTVAFSAKASMNAEYACYLEGFGPFVEKTAGNLPQTIFVIPQDVSFVDPAANPPARS